MRWPKLVVDLVVDDDDQRRFRIDRRAYRDPQIFAHEQVAIFEHSWLYAGHASELPAPGDFITRTVARHPLLITRTPEGDVRVLYNTCSHRGAMVCPEPHGNTRSFTCPYHAWTFDLQGRLRGIVGRGALDPSRHDGDLCAARFEIYRELIFVTFDPAAPSLLEFLAGAREHLDLILDQGFDAGMELVPGVQRYEIRANWKLLAENSIDTYHVMTLHRRYLEYLGTQGVRINRPTGRAFQLGNGHAVSETAPAVSGKPVAFWGPPMPVTKKPELAVLRARLVERYGEDRARAIGETQRQLLIFPNLMVIDGSATTIRTWDPLAVDRISVSAWALAPRDQLPEDRALAIQAFLTFFGPGGFATPDDVEILERLQEGLANTSVRWADCSRGMGRADRSLDSELPLRAFWRQWLRSMAGSDHAGGST